MLFQPPTNTLEFLILSNSIWSMTVAYHPTYLAKHTAAQAHQHRFTVFPLDAESPLFNKVVDDIDEDEE
jgi:hypothetical protein